MAISVDDFATTSIYKNAYYKIQHMLNDTAALSFEDAVFAMENAWHENKLDKLNLQSMLDFHTERILMLAHANKERIKNIFPLNYSGISIITKEEQEKLNEEVLLNWAIYTYMTDTTWWKEGDKYIPNFPIEYKTEDPYGNENWEISQVSYLLNSKNKRGNCFSMSLLYYLFSVRLQSNAYLTTAPQHIYIQHRSFDGNFYNVELTTKIFPGSGTIKSQTHASHHAITNSVAMRRLNEKEAIALCAVYLGKGYERKISLHSQNKKLNEEFILQCTRLALQFDSLCLSAMFLKVQALQKILQNDEQGYNDSDLLKTIKLNIEDYTINNLNHDNPIFALSIDPLAEKFPGMSPYNAMDNNPVNMIDPDGNNAVIIIDQKKDPDKVSNKRHITAKAIIYIYGPGATYEEAERREKFIMQEHIFGRHFRYYDREESNSYDVEFDVSVKLYNNTERADPFFRPASNPFNNSMDNFVRVEKTYDDSNLKLYDGSDLTFIDEYYWVEGESGYQSNYDIGLVFGFGKQADHMLIKDDFFSNRKTIYYEYGYHDNLMSKGDGYVQQVNIDKMLSEAVRKYNHMTQGIYKDGSFETKYIPIEGEIER
jgi:hypothetical protein